MVTPFLSTPIAIPANQTHSPYDITMRTILISYVMMTLCVGVFADSEQASKDRLFLETLARLDIDINTNKAVKNKLNAVLDRNRGTELFVEAVVRYKLTDRGNDLLDTALTKPTDTIGVNATKAIFAFGQHLLFNKTVTGSDVKRAEAAVTVLGYANDKRAFDLLSGLATDTKNTKAARSNALTALSRTRPGERIILQLAAKKKLPDDLKFIAANTLFTSSDPKIRDQAKKHLALPKGVDQKPLPPITELADRSGDATEGKAVFTKATCVNCHKLDGAGVDFGPDLSDIGNKLPKVALYTSILDPSAGILMGYEGWTITTAFGEETIGYIIGEMKTHLTLKVPGGIITKLAKDEIESKKKFEQSLMPTNLQLVVTQQELVDLVEYLSKRKISK